MVNRLERIYLSPEAKRMAKMKASSDGKSLKDWLDEIVMRETKDMKRENRGDKYRFF